MTLEGADSNLLDEWDYDRNDLSPSDVSTSSHQKIWWKCSNGHSWWGKVGVRSKRKQGRPYCSNHRVIVGKTDLKTQFPKIAAEWNYERNGELKPEHFLPNSNKKLWWRCERGHEWKIAIASRQVNGCPYCSGRYAIPGETDLKTLCPEDALDWSYNRNGNMIPENCKPHTRKKVFWKCHVCGYEWEQNVHDKVKSKHKCPRCKRTT